jgi:AcrR family transcriptional regulator
LLGLLSIGAVNSWDIVADMGAGFLSSVRVIDDFGEQVRLVKNAVPATARAGQQSGERVCSLNEAIVTKRTRKRAYRLSARAESQAETRRQIVEAAVALHEKLGPAQTPFSAIAERAGVTRLTLYRHFPDEAALFAACTSHWGALHPFPDAVLWNGIKDPASRAAAALAAHYDYYAGTRRMWSVAYRDVGLVKPIQPVLAHVDDHLTQLAESLAAAFRAKGETLRALMVTLRHALAYQTWASLEARGLDTAAKVALLARWLEGARK